MHSVFEAVAGAGIRYRDFGRRVQLQLEREIAEAVVDSILEMLVQVCWNLAFAVLEEVAADSFREAAVVDNTLETPVQDSAEVVHNPEPLQPSNAVAAEVVERDRNPEPLPPDNAVAAAPLEVGPHPYTADSPAHPRQSGSHPAAPLAEGLHFPAAGSR